MFRDRQGYAFRMSIKNQNASRPGREKSANYEAKRDEVARAALLVIARDGLERASMRAIAQEIGCTTGVLTHYFRDKDALLDFALKSIVNALEDDGNEDPSVRSLDAFTTEVANTLPRDADSKQMWRVWLSFTAAAFSRPEHHKRHHLLYEAIREHWVQRFLHLSQANAFSAPIDVKEEAALLFCLIDGIGVQSIISPRQFSASQQRHLIYAHLARLPWKD